MASKAWRRSYIYGALQTTSCFRPNTKRLNFISLTGARYYPGAGLKELKQRMATIKSITKVTQSMKMIASAKLQKQQDRLQRARAYFNSSQAYNEFKYPVLDKTDEFYAEKKQLKETEDKGNEIVIAITSDRGLCGGVNTNVSKEVARLLRVKPNAWLVALGDKAVQQLQREFSQKVLLGVSDITGNRPITYYEVSTIADVILQQPGWKKVTLVYSYFTSIVQSTLESREIPDFQTVLEDEHMHVPFYLGDYKSVIHSAYDHAFAGLLFGAILEAQTCEIGARMAAMENATKNGNELVELLLKQYNKQRQSLITTELIEIVSGANAVDATMKNSKD